MIPGLPTMKLECKNKHIWFCVIPGWVSNWKDIAYPDCNCKPKTFTWGGLSKKEENEKTKRSV